MFSGDKKNKTITVLLMLIFLTLISSCNNDDHNKTIMEESIYSGNIRSLVGEPSEIYLYSNDYVINEKTWAGAAEGDLVYSGYFGLAYRSAGDKELTTYPLDEELSINMTRDAVYVINSTDLDIPDLLWIEVAEASNISTVYSFYVGNDELIAVEPMIATYVAKDSNPKELVVLKYIGYFTEINDGKEWIKEYYSLDVEGRKLRLVSMEYISAEDAYRFLNSSGYE